MSTASAAVLLVWILQLGAAGGQDVCERQTTAEWRLEPSAKVIKWSPGENICSDFYTQCWDMDPSGAGESSEAATLSVPQLCPLQLQLGDSLFISPEPSSQPHGFSLANVSREEFLHCPTDDLQKQLVIVCQAGGLQQVAPKWLGVGSHYFTELQGRGPSLCPRGLRLNVTVKQQLCQGSPADPLCSGHGRCLSHLWDRDYRCHCSSHYSGRFCQSFDVCSTNPCRNKGSCTARPELPGGAYECRCPPMFSGQNCTEIVGQCQPGACLKGNCTNLTPNTFLCECERGFTGAFCEEPADPCASQPCPRGSTCQSHHSGHVCVCPAGFQGDHCETAISGCSSRPCQSGGSCVVLPNDVACVCLPGFTGKFCETALNPCETSPCLNNATCVAQLQSYSCSCTPGFPGTPCQEPIHCCVLLRLGCRHQGVCLSAPGGFTCLCAAGWTGELCQLAANACLIHPNPCADGATCIDVSQPGEQPLLRCLCPYNLTGASCEMQIGNCGSSSCANGGTCADYEGHFKCICPPGSGGERCQLALHACLLCNSSCAPGAACVHPAQGFNYSCLAPCPADTEVCANGGSCFYEEEKQRAHCVCAPGWTGQGCLENINDCEENQCQHGATCEDETNQYSDDLDEGIESVISKYADDNKLGEDVGETCSVQVAECLDRPCWNGGVCEEDLSGFRCNCSFGFSGQFCELERSGCASAPCWNGAACLSSGHTYDCFCPQGFEGLNCEINVDECTYGFCQSNSTCLDLVAGYSCVCPPGFTGKNCSTGLQECSFQPCKNGGQCHQLNGELYCSCLPGFTGQFCEADAAACLSQPCGASSICRETLGGYACFCAPGYIGNNCETEVDECLSDPCHHGATCVDHLNAFSCLCQDGFQGPRCEADINECLSSPCLHNSSCADLHAGYQCLCLPGFTGARCETDIDECASMPCKNGATCLDRPGSYFCQCLAPFKGVQCELRACEASNPCENGAQCLEEANLEAFPLGFQCQCAKGFAGPRCEINIDECGSEPCLHGFCYDIVDGFYCLCNPGYAGPTCEQDIDDCIGNACQHQATCVDLHLSYRCLCPPGWEGRFCEQEADRCRSEPCRNNGSCTALGSTYRCSCAPGWAGPDCSEDVNECDSEPCLNGATCHESARQGQFVCLCPPFYTGALCQLRFSPCQLPHNPCRNNSTCLAQADGSPMCICRAGFEGTHCEVNSDECISHPCQNEGLCVDGVNHFRCSCQHGFTGTLCEVEINECLSRPCRNNGTCLDLRNRFLCSCAPGYYGTLCEMDVNECEALPCLHGGSCINRLGGYGCLCPPGFTGARCEANIDECLSGPCLNGGSCIDAIGAYQCHCRRGFGGAHCETDINDCWPDPCLHGSCTDLVDGYLCSCDPGWTSSRCETNINECESAPCINGGSCQDALNAFLCTCPSGYTGRLCEVDVDVCSEALGTALCSNGGVCVDGPGRAFHCRCLAGFSGQLCELEVNECSSAPCLHGSTCEDLVNGYSCHCQPGWEGLHCELDVDECLSSPCIHGICVQQEPTFGYSCFCKPGFVGRSCELNYDDCLLRSCSPGFLCVDGINNISCLPATPHSRPPAPQVAEASPDELLGNDLPPALPVSVDVWSKEVSPGAPSGEVAQDFSAAHYQGDSYLQFQGWHLSMENFIHLEFITSSPHGLLLYVAQSPGRRGQFLLQLFIQGGSLQLQFACGEAAEVRSIAAAAGVDDGRWYEVQVRHSLAPCEAEMSVLGLPGERSSPQRAQGAPSRLGTGPVFVGGLPGGDAVQQRAGPGSNFTGCIQLVQVNSLGPFNLSSAVGRSKVERCRIPVPSPGPAALPLRSPAVPGLPEPAGPSEQLSPLPPVCQEGLCQNGGTCQPLTLPTGASSFQCHCPLHFTGRFCQKDTALFFPSFTGNSYLELPPLAPGSGSRAAPGQEPSSVTTLHLTVKTTAPRGTILYTGERSLGEQFLHLYLVEGRPTARLGCGSSQNILTVSLRQAISQGSLTPITLSFTLPGSSPEGSCMIELAAAGSPPVQHKLSLPYPAPQVIFGAIFLGSLPAPQGVPGCAGEIHGFQGCIRDFQVNQKELFLIEEAVGGRNVENCEVPVCAHQPCRNGGTCTSNAEHWFCECPKLYSGKLCQFASCDGNPCGNGATCVPKSSRDAVCLCPYGRAGILCTEVISISQPSFSGTDAFGYTSFLAYSTIPNISLSHEFHLKFQLANHHSALEDNLIFFTGQKGQGLNGDDFLELGLRKGRVVYSYNLGSGTATITSEPLDLTLDLHVVHLGRHLQEGWLKVDEQENRTSTSPGRLLGLNVFSQFYLGGYGEYTPELLPKGSRFQSSFEGCIFEVQVRSSREQEFSWPGAPAGQPSSGRSVGQCRHSPCSLIRCSNGGQCRERGASVYCECLPGWKGAFCTEAVSVCDPEHHPPHLCQQGGTCVPLPSGYSCHCPLGTAGDYCEQAVSISDASFRSNHSSWMSFAPFYIRHRTHIQLQFQPLAADGILFYTAQHLGSRAGDFLCISLLKGFVQLRYNLGDRTITLQSLQQVPTAGHRWHLLQAGRVGNEGYLQLDSINVSQAARPGRRALDTRTEFFVGGVSSPHLVHPLAAGGGPSGFSGCLREAVVNGRELLLTAAGASGGANVGDCDGTACGYGVCGNRGTCLPRPSGFSCACPLPWAGSTCRQHLLCAHTMCGPQAVCLPRPAAASYVCLCSLGWAGRFCRSRVSFFIAEFVGGSYIKYRDPLYPRRDLRHSRISLNFSTSQAEGLLAWMGEGQDEDDDFLAIGLAGGRLKVVVNLGERISVPLVDRQQPTCSDRRWHVVTVLQNQTCIKVYLDEELVVFEDIDPRRTYTALNYGGVCYLGGFELGREVSEVTRGLFHKDFVGKVKDVVLFQDSRKIQLMKAEGFNVHRGNQGK
ncbi:LOW QUALITY PROTEIN: protein eyes shut homolog [Melanerpes formicivorus]|uniref:LOW QUALITY PROTEIN: protein eyes shut homolog n=1 Tax=Melanerpes formicivorus TaxID=211600 RepID=UPI00358E63BB